MSVFTARVYTNGLSEYDMTTEPAEASGGPDGAFLADKWIIQTRLLESIAINTAEVANLLAQLNATIQRLDERLAAERERSAGDGEQQ
jgi:hypothetical protein